MMSLINPADRIFVAGSRGMAGRAIVKALLRKGYGDPAQGGALLTPSRSELNLLDAKTVDTWFAGNQPTVVVLAAATVGGIEANRSRPADFLLQNLKIETHTIENAWQHGTRRLLFLGSSCIYPKHANQPIREEALLTGNLEPTNEWYAIAKIAGIKLGAALRKQYGFDAISLMPTNLYGPGDNYHPSNSHVLPAMIRRFQEAAENNQTNVSCWGTGAPLREFLYADDLGEASVFALEKWDPDKDDSPKDEMGQALNFLNVGTGIDLSIRELAQKIASTVGFEGTIEWDTTKPDGTPRKQLDVSRMTSLGWQASIPLEKGLALTAADFREKRQNGELRD